MQALGNTDAVDHVMTFDCKKKKVSDCLDNLKEHCAIHLWVILNPSVESLNGNWEPSMTKPKKKSVSVLHSYQRNIFFFIRQVER